MMRTVFLLGIILFNHLSMSVSYQVSRGAGSLVKQIASNSNLISPLLSSKDNQNRNLQAFSTLNSIFSEVTLVFPDSSLSSNGLDLTISELTCSELSVQDIQLGHNSLSDTTKRIFINISGLEITCNYRWSYKWTIFSGSGFGVALLDPSSFASINFDFVSEDFEQYPPKDVNIDDCKSEVQIGDLNFDGDGLGFISSILNLFEGMLRDRIEGEVDTAVCTELKGLGDGALDDLLVKFSNNLDAYLDQLPEDTQDPLSLENSLSLKNDASLYLNFLELHKYAGDWINTVLEKIDEFVGASEGNGELGFNSFIRDNFLNANGNFVVDPLTLMTSNTIFEAHDMLTETVLSIESISIRGLDTFKELDLMNAIGNHTLKNTLKLESLSIVVDMKAFMKASSLSDAVISAPNSSPVDEKFSVTIAFSDIEIDFSVLLALNTEVLGNLQLGPLLNTDNVLQCIMSAAEHFSFSELSISVLDVAPPSLSGFIDTGIDKIVSTGATALFDMYESVLIKAMPNFFNTFVREKLNAFVKDALQLLDRCEGKGHPLDGFVDFRELLLNPEDESSNGGSGRIPYGNILPWVWELVQDELFSADENGLLVINDALIAPITKSQSGVEGLILLNQTILDLNKDYVKMDIWRAFADNLRLSLSNLRISGLDTLREPFYVIKPSSKSGSLLQNHISFGIENRSLNAEIQFEIKVGDAKTSPLATSNTMDFKVALPAVEIIADLFAKVQESKFMSMPLKSALNLNCWLSMIHSPTEAPVDISKRDTSHLAGLAVHNFDVLVEGFTGRSTCISCSNTALEDFDEVMSFLDKNDFFLNVRSRGVAILSEMFKSEWMIGVFDRKIQLASARCPDHPSYGALAADFDASKPQFKASRELVDGVLYSGMTMVQIIAVVLAQKHGLIEVPPPANIQLDVPKDARLVDLTNLTSVASWADILIAEASIYLGTKQQSDDGADELGIVNVLRALILDDNGLLTVPIVDEGFRAGGVVLSLYNVTLIGLDSFTSFDVLNITGPQSFSNHLKLKTLGVSVDMGLSVGGNELEKVTASLVLKDVNVDASFLTAMDKDILGDLKLGSIMNTTNIFLCILSAIHTIELSEFVMDIGDIERFSLSGFMAKATDDSIKEFTQSVFEKYKPMVLESIPAFTSTTVRSLLNGIFQVLVEMGKAGSCPDPAVALENKLVDFRDLFLRDRPYGDLFRMLFNFVKESTALSNDNGLSMVNDVLVSKFTDHGNLHWDGEIFSREMKINLNGLNVAISLAIRDVQLANLNTLAAPVRVLQPVKREGSILNNSATIGVEPNPLRVSFTLFVSGEGDLKVNNTVELGLSLSSTSLLLELLAKIKEKSLLGFALRDLTNINCWLSTVVTPVLDQYGIRVGDKTLALENIILAVTEAQLDMHCISCTSPLLLEMSSYFESAEGIADTTKVANRLLEYGASLLGGDFFQNMIDKFLNEAALKCPHSPIFDQNFNALEYENIQVRATAESSYGFLLAILLVILAMIVVSAGITLMVKYINRRRHNRWVKELSRNQVLQLAEEEKYEALRKRDIDCRMKALAWSNESVPSVLRFGIPIVVLGNIGLFLSGHLSLGGTVNISGQFAGQSFDIAGFFEFSMAKSTIEMWNAGAHSLAILIVIFSGVWPYTKQIVIFVLWFLPPKGRVSSKLRGEILHWLDILGKWSMVDVFVLLMSLASFRISIESPSHLEFLPDDLFEVHMLVIPMWGLYANMLAQIVSQISSHMIIHYHRKTTTAAAAEQDNEWNIESPSRPEENKVALRKHNFKLDYEASTSHASVRKGVSAALSVLTTAFVLLVISGCSIPSFSIESVGLLGLAVESMNEFRDAIVYYSVFDLARMIVDEARYLDTASNYLGLGTLSSILVITVFLVPLFQAVSLLIEWFHVMEKSQRQKNLVVHEILSSWQYMEVYVLSVVIAAWQLGGVSEYMINAYCSSLENLFTTLSFYGILKESDAQCFRVNASVEKASWMLVAASIILILLNHFVVSASLQMEQDHIVPSNRRLHTDRWLTNKETMSLDEEEDAHSTPNNEVSVSPVASRFTDFYSFVTIKEESSELNPLALSAAETEEGAVETPCEVESTNTFWDVPLDNNSEQCL